MATLEVAFLHSQLEERKHRLEAAIALAPQKAGFVGLLREVDSALERMAKGSYGLCQESPNPKNKDHRLPDRRCDTASITLRSHNELRCNVTSIWPPKCSAIFCHK